MLICLKCIKYNYAVKSTTDAGPHIRFVRRKGSAAEEMTLQIISGRTDKIRTTVASFAESYGINCRLVLCLDIFIPIAGRTLRRLFYYICICI